MPRGPGRLGFAVGVALILMPVTYFAAGGSAFVSDPSAGLSNPLVIIGFAIATLGLVVAYPVWAILVGRVFIRRQVVVPEQES